MKPIIRKRVHLSPYKCFLTFYLSTFYHQQIGTRKQHIQLVEIFRKSTISNFSKAKCVFDNFKSMFYFATYSGFSVFNVTFPVNRMIRYLRQAFRTAADAKIDLTKMFVVFDFIPFLNSNISAVSICNMIVLPQ